MKYRKLIPVALLLAASATGIILSSSLMKSDTSTVTPSSHVGPKAEITPAEEPTTVALEAPDPDSLNQSRSSEPEQTAASVLEHVRNYLEDHGVIEVGPLNDAELEIAKAVVTDAALGLTRYSDSENIKLRLQSAAFAEQYRQQMLAADAGEFLVLPPDTLLPLEQSIYDQWPNARLVRMMPLPKESPTWQAVFVLDQSPGTQLHTLFQQYYRSTFD
jgi:hypothetical protein